MKLGRLTATNFCNYEHLDLDLADRGITLVTGNSGAGKSTICDAISWTLFGSTSKDVSADDIRPWKPSQKTITVLEVDNLEIHRRRGDTPQQNDLFIYNKETGETIRGKTVTETQQLVCQAIGFTEELFFRACYFHQFSNHGNFFISKPKERREILENVVNQALPNGLSEKISAERKQVTKELEDLQRQILKVETQIEGSKSQINKLAESSNQWELNKEATAQVLRQKADSFEADKKAAISRLVLQHQELSSTLVEPTPIAERLHLLRKQLDNYAHLEQQLSKLKEQRAGIAAEIRHLDTEVKRIEHLPDTCPTCFSKTDSTHTSARIEDLYQEISAREESLVESEARLETLTKAISAKPKVEAQYQELAKEETQNNNTINKLQLLDAQIKVEKEKENIHLTKLSDLISTHDPYLESIISESKRLGELTVALTSYQDTQKQHDYRLMLLDRLSDVVVKLRGAIISREVQTLEAETNKILDEYYDAELRVKLLLEGDDKLGVQVTRHGHECSFRQLSGGQRCILKLAFSFAFMQSALNKSGQTVNVLMLDEALNGLSEQLKVQTFQFLTSLTPRFSTIILVDHSAELERLCDNQIKVSGNPPELEFV